MSSLHGAARGARNDTGNKRLRGKAFIKMELMLPRAYLDRAGIIAAKSRSLDDSNCNRVAVRLRAEEWMAGWLSKIYAPIRRVLPRPIANFIRSTVTAFVTPGLHYTRSGHFRSAYAMRAVDISGHPLPWYSYPCIDFLAQRDFSGRTVLEFGGGQSTHWWAARAPRVVTLEADAAWAAELRTTVPAHVTVTHIAEKSGPACVSECEAAIRDIGIEQFDVIVIDGLDRGALSPLSQRLLKPGGVIILDNAAGYGFWEAFRESGMMRVDFYGAAPGVITRHSTSIVFGPDAFVFSAAWPIARLT